MTKSQALFTILSVLLFGCRASIDGIFDVVNILRLDKNGEGGFEPYGDFYVDILGNARGLPLVRNTSAPIVDTGYENFCCRNWVRDGWKETPQPQDTHLPPPLDSTKQSNGLTVAPLWQLDSTKGELKSPAKQLQAHRYCIFVLIRLPVNSTLTITLQRAEDIAKPISGEWKQQVTTLRGRDSEYDWILRRFEARTPKPLRDKPTVLVLTAEKAETADPVYVQWAGFCEPATQEQRVRIKGKFSAENASEQARRVMTNSAYSVVGGGCQNGGRLWRFEVCECSPGFHGELCEAGCGANKYGFECRGKCSDGKEGRDCAGFKACHSEGVCACMPGWEGEACERKCRTGWYGSGCDQRCGACKGGDTCNRHAGQCDEGCEDGFQPPLCQNVCGRETSTELPKDGSIADPIDFPWNAALYDEKRGGSEPYFICSATLVTSSLLITAAHCVFDRETLQAEEADRYIVVFGRQRHALNLTDIYENRTQRRKLTSIHVPPNYRDVVRAYADDIAVLEMVQEVDLSDLTRPACFDWTGKFQPDLEQVGNGEVVGWGFDENGKTVDKMLLARPAYRSLGDCIKSVEQSFVQFLTPDKFCGVNTGRQALRRGNSGGGLIFDSFLVGVTSVGSPNDYKTIGYTNVTYHINWLNKVRTEIELQKAVRSNATK